ncbi:MAG TPA: DNA-formamidopyrimidine glycosylase family protein [Polyangiaceae bacterium]|nr:DNA-formamidopyrimidine glycosylase family protein [Polyangiaceae bacterium]
MSSYALGVPELPDVEVYVERLRAHLVGQRITGFRLPKPFLVRTFDPPLEAAVGRRVLGFSRIGKRIVFELSGPDEPKAKPKADLFLVLHLMIAGRLHLGERGKKLPGRIGLLGIDFDENTLILTEAGSKRRASLHLVRGRASLPAFVRGGVEPFEVSEQQFAEALQRETRTLKRALCDPTIVSGVGNAYSDEILHRARLSPMQRTSNLTPEELGRLFSATRQVLREWLERLRKEAGEGFPEKVTAFRPEMAVHGKYRQPCLVCGTAVQRIVYANNECNYCPRCQTDGKLLADRVLSRLLTKDFPRTIEDLEELAAARARGV